MNTDMNKDQEMLDETRVMERLTDETTVIDMGKMNKTKQRRKITRKKVRFFRSLKKCLFLLRWY